MDRRIVIADDHPLMRGAIRTAVEKVWPDLPITEVSDADAVKTELASGGVELLTLDLSMPGSTGLNVLMELRKLYPAVPVVIISASGDDRILAGAKEFGASGFIAKTASLTDMSDTLRKVSEGDICFPEIADTSDDTVSRLASLTPAQTRILHFLSEGLLNKQIAYEMDISEATVKAHITAIFRRLGVTNRTQAVLAAKHLEASEP